MNNDKMVRRIAAAILSATLLAVPTLGGCSSSQAPSGSAQASSASQQTVDQASAEHQSQNVDATATPLDSALAYAKSQDVEQGAGHEWLAFALARAGEDPTAAPLSSFPESMENSVAAAKGELDASKATEYAKCSLALTALGMDARNVGGYDVTAKLHDTAFVEAQGANGPIWGLIALDATPAYTESEEAKTARDALLAQVLASQGDDGGWSCSGKSGEASDVDLTAMALTALAPYNDASAHPDATAAIERGLAFISAAEEPDGGFAFEGTESSETASQVVIALCSLGIDPASDERFAHDDASPLSNLLEFQDASGGFSHLKGDPADALASDQGVCALVAVERLRTGQSPLYEM